MRLYERQGNIQLLAQNLPLVEAPGGAVSAESTHGAGATFRFTIPTAPEH